MAKHKILFPVETTNRELLYKLLLAARFAERGHECYLGEKPAVYKMFGRVSPFLYFDKGYHPAISDDLYDAVIRHGGLLANLDEEGGVDFEDSSTILSRYPLRLFEVCDSVFLWGHYQRELLQDRIQQADPSKTIVSGHPRFQLLQPQFRKLYDHETASIRSAFGDFVLVNTNMGFGNNIRGDDFVRENYGGRVAELETVMAYDKIKVRAFVSLVTKLCRAGFDVVVRPHPEENGETYAAPLRGLTGATVRYEGPVMPWILAASVMVHADCTTGIEASMLGKKGISYLPPHQWRRHTSLPVKLSYVFEGEDEVVRFVSERGYETEAPLKSDETLLREHFAYGTPSYELIVDRTTALMEASRGRERREFGKRDVLAGRARALLTSARVRMTAKSTGALIGNKMSGFGARSVTDALERLMSVLHLNRDLRLERLTRSLYRIR